jgi:L-threonylcarbamoyladenylate synthase
MLRDEVANAFKVLQEGGIILYPTDTIWGIGCDATNAEAIKKIFRLKQRDEAKSMVILIDT